MIKSIYRAHIVSILSIHCLLGMHDLDKRAFKEFLPENPIILDAGAHDGHDTAEFAQMFPQGIIYAFEPVPEIFERLRQRTLYLPNVVPFQLALSNKKETRELFISRGHYNGRPESRADASSSFLPPKDHLAFCPNIFFDQKIAVSCVTLDEWATAHNIPKIDLMWLDLQGFELSALRAAENILSRTNAIYTEANLQEVYEGCDLHDDLCNFLAERGFVRKWEGTPEWGQTNILFVHTRLLAQ